MAENECVPEYDCREYFKEAVCIDAQRVYDSCSDKDCLENVLQLLRQNRLSISNMEITRSAGSEEHNACAIFALHLKKGCRTEDLIQKIQRIEGVVSVEEI